MHQKGYKSVYVPEVLAEGLATEDLVTYSKQQFRWARGALDVIFRYNPFFRRGLSLPQKIQYFASASFYLSGIVVLFDILLPLTYFFTGAVPVSISGMLLAAVFIPYMFLTLYVIQRTSNFTFTFQSLGFSMGAWNIHLRAFYAAALRQRSSFQITQKVKGGIQTGALSLVTWHCVYAAAVALGIVVAVVRDGVSASLINNAAWGLLNAVIFFPFIKAALSPKAPARTVPNIQERARRVVKQYGEIRKR